MSKLETSIVLIYFRMHKMKGHQKIANRRQRRLWGAVDKPYMKLIKETADKIFREMEYEIMYGRNRSL